MRSPVPCPGRTAQGGCSLTGLAAVHERERRGVVFSRAHRCQQRRTRPSPAPTHSADPPVRALPAVTPNVFRWGGRRHTAGGVRSAATGCWQPGQSSRNRQVLRAHSRRSASGMPLCFSFCCANFSTMRPRARGAGLQCDHAAAWSQIGRERQKLAREIQIDLDPGRCRCDLLIAAGA